MADHEQRNEGPRGRLAEGKIQLLATSLVDQIAAGEVVERPASVVKELVENGLDAGATRIRIDVRDGGKALIAVTDNGHGMPPGDLRLALERHATSKLRELDDLDRVLSFGFRGEALPSIASISKLRIFSRARGSDEGHELRIDGGEILDARSAGGPEGTRVEVVDLFCRVPARRKFLKQASTEWGHIADWMGRLAMSLPGVHFELRRDERPPVIWPATADPLDRIAAVLGEAEADAMQHASSEDAGGHLDAYVSSPDSTRSNANALYLYVNGRPVRDKVMRHALLQAYRDLLPRGRFPTAVLFLTLPPGAVDVNVHPAKWEVRFADPQSIHRLIRRAVRDAMAGRGWLGAGPSAAPEGAQATQSARTSLPPGPPATGAPLRVHDTPESDWRGAPKAPAEPLATSASVQPLPGLDADPARSTVSHEDRPGLQFGGLRLLGQLLASYLLVEAKDGLLLVDQHAAHERVLYERLRQQWLEQKVERQGLLLAINVELDPLEAAALAEHVTLVERLGFEVEPFGDGAVVIRAVPSLLGGQDPSGLLRSLAAELESEPPPAEASRGEELRLLPAVDRVFATLACHGARRFGDHLDPREQRQILEDLDTIPWAPTCPHGRPVAVSMPLPEIERRFGRR